MPLLVFFSVLPAGAQEADSLRRAMRLPQPPTFEVGARGQWIAPGITVGVPSGYGADWGDAFIGAGFQATTRYVDHADGGIVAGFGIGDARRYVGLEVAASSFGTFRSCCRGGVSAKVHRVLPADASIAVGWENALVWGELEVGQDIATDAGTSLFAVASKVFRLREDPASVLGSMTLTAGAGNGRFRSEDDILNERETVEPFGSVAVRLGEPLSGVASWTGQDLNAGLSIVPLRRVPLFITPAFADLTTSPRFILGVGYGFNFTSIF